MLEDERPFDMRPSETLDGYTERLKPFGKKPLIIVFPIDCPADVVEKVWLKCAAMNSVPDHAEVLRMIESETAETEAGHSSDGEI